MNKVFSLGCQIPAGTVSHIELDSDHSLLDADIVVLEPSVETIILGYSLSRQVRRYRGKKSLDENASFEIMSILNHWRGELLGFVRSGGIAFVNLCEIQEVYIDTGEKEYSGTGRNRETTRLVDLISNYQIIPLDIGAKAAIGTSMKLNNSDHLLEEYWGEFSDESAYKVYLEDKGSIAPIVCTARGERTVGAIYRHKNGGAFVFLPWINFRKEEFFATEEKARPRGQVENIVPWSRKAKAWGEKYIKIIQAAANSIKAPIQETATPEWVQDTEFKNHREVDLQSQLVEINQSIETLHDKAHAIQGEIASNSWPKCLLFENGPALEQAVIKSMRLLGFQAEQFASSQSEFDVVLEYGGLRFIGEIEGRDNKSIDIKKMRQLAMNLKEDLQRDGVSVQARGILFGNAHRLNRPSERPNECFTRKCLETAKVDRTILIRTCDLFVVANYLSCTEDSTFANACRDSIIKSNGTQVIFPSLESTKRK